jgi:hypothetical protein
MPNRIVFVVLTIALCASVALGSLDIATEILSPRTSEAPGLVPVTVRLSNLGDTAALVPRLDVKIDPAGYRDYRQNIPVGAGGQMVLTLNPWVYSGGTETCTAYITYPADTNHTNDTDVVIVNASGISGGVEMKPCAGISLTLSPSPLAGSVLHVEYSLGQVGPASVILFDISGRPVATRRFVADRSGELSLDLRFLSRGVYVVRLDDGRSAVTQKLVVQR